MESFWVTVVYLWLGAMGALFAFVIYYWLHAADTAAESRRTPSRAAAPEAAGTQEERRERAAV